MVEIKTFQAVLDDMKAWMIANQDKVTDFNDGSIILSFLEAISQQFEQGYIRARVGFTKSLKNIPYEAFDFQKKTSIKATGQVRFGRTAPAVANVTISAGTIVSTDAGTEFETTAGTTILAGQTQSALVGIVALEGGKSGNVLPGAITQIPNAVSGVDTVTNTLGTAGGVDAESDYDFELRFREYIEGLGRSSESGLIYAAKTVEAVRSASFIEHVPALDGVYHGTLYLDDGSGTATPETVAAVAAAIDGDGTEQNPGYRAAGLKYRILAPTVVLIDVTVTVTNDGTVDKFLVQQNIETALTAYINALPIGRDVIANRLIDTIMGVQGVLDIDMTVPTGNTAISDSQVARVGALTVTV